MLGCPPDPRSGSDPPRWHLVQEVKSELDLLLRWHDEAPSQAKREKSLLGRSRDPAALRAYAAKEIARIYAQVFGVAPARRSRHALVRRINALANGRDPYAGSDGIAMLLEGAFDKISDEDLAPTLGVWKAGPGAKAAGSHERSKWVTLARVINEKWGHNVTPATLAREAKKSGDTT
jgi:hypothetical protein